MGEKAAHQFLKATFSDALRSFSKLRLYGYTEAERRKFDLACVLERDWSRPVVGQVAWHHRAGIDKDVRTLLTDPDSEIKVYIAQDSVRYRSAVADVVGDFRRSGRFPELFQLKTFWIPADFDADQPSQRAAIEELLKERVVEDLLFNVVFGNITPNDVRLVLTISGIPALALAILHYVATRGYFNEASLALDLNVSKGPVREKLVLLQALGLMTGPDREAYFLPTTKGKVLLELFRRVFEDLATGEFTPELLYLLERLQCPRPSLWTPAADDKQLPSTMFGWLVWNVRHSVTTWGIDWPELTYEQASSRSHAARNRGPTLV